MDFSVQNEIDAVLMVRQEKDERKKTSWSPTDLGKCLSGVYYKRLGIKPDKEPDGRKLRVFAVGKYSEDWVVSVLKEKHPEIQTQARIEIPEWDCTGYADAVLYDEILEFKTQHSKSFWYMTKGGGGANIQHRMQIWTYLKALNKERGRIIYISKDDNAIQEYPVFLNSEELAEKVANEFVILNKAWKEQKPPEPAPAIIRENGKCKLNWICSYCDTHKTCTGNPNWREEAEIKIKELNNS